jgi:pectin methylesterase-like acyl-CoA thioesterase
VYRLSAVIVVASLGLGVSHGRAEEAASATWALDSTATTSVATSGGAAAEDETVSSLYVIRDYAGTDGSQRVYAAGSGLGYWPDETTQNLDRYAQFRVSPKAGLSLHVTTATLFVGNSGGSSDVKASIFYSTDDFATSTALEVGIAAPNSALQQQNYTLDVQIPDGGSFSLRVCPWLQGGRASGKYFNIKDVGVSGTTSGAAVVSLAKLVTMPVTRISTTTAQSGGTILADGGGPVTARGVCWNTAGTPTVGDSTTFDGTGTGGFTSTLTGLEADTTYYVRAYATNAAGTSYGSTRSFKTLAQLSPPVVTTAAVSTILTTTAVSGGTVSSDGGLDVTARGVCWNTTGSPTILDANSISGSGLGTYQSGIAGLMPQTQYFLRAYATNGVGTSYGAELSFTTAAPKPPITIAVAQDGSGDYATVQAAFDAVPSNYTGPITILVKPGTYKEKLLLESNQINVTLAGEDANTTILTYDDYSGRIAPDGTTLGTSTSYSVAIDASDFAAHDITFENTSQAAQAVALRVNGDRVVFTDCRMIGYQDTYYTYGYGRIYNKNCYIEGTVDFIFGRSIAVFDHCIINSKRNSTITAASTEENYRFGYVLLNCTFMADAGITRVQLGRPWRPYAQTVVLYSYLGSHIDPAGWSEWSGNENHLTAYYAEYQNTGPGYVPASRVSWSHQLTEEEAAAYTVQNVFSKYSTDPPYAASWLPPEAAEENK